MKRREFLAGTATAGAMASLSKFNIARAQSKPKQIVVMTWGGRHGDTMASGIDKAFTEATGIKVVQDRSAAPPQRITKLQLALNDQVADVVQLPDSLIPFAVKQG